MTKEKIATQPNTIPSGNVLMIQPRYVHATPEFETDASPYLPLSLIYAGALLEQKENTRVTYNDCQLHDLSDRCDLQTFDNFGITVMGAQNIASAARTYTQLLQSGIPAQKTYFGGQGIEDLTKEEFTKLFPNANLVTRETLTTASNYYGVDLSSQLTKFSSEDLQRYYSGEITLPFSQGCKYSCTFCGAQTTQREKFFEVGKHYTAIAKSAKQVGVTILKAYATSLDFFQQASSKGNVALLESKLKELIVAQAQTGIGLQFRFLTRADSYMDATKNFSLMDLAKKAGVYQCGFGADGAANISLLRAMKKGTTNLRSSLIDAFGDVESRGWTPEMLYVFGIEADNSQTLDETFQFCTELLETFPHSIYRGFPAKDNIPGNANWLRQSWKETPQYQVLMSNPRNFLNLGFETLANSISHADINKRKLVNKCAIKMSETAHKLGRVQSYLTIPPMQVDGNELMDSDSFEGFRGIISIYEPQLAKQMTLENLPQLREKINTRIPKDK